MKRRAVFPIVVMIVLATVFFPVLALQISQIEFDLHQAAGSTATYSFKVINNESQTQEITVYLSDWTRTATGENDFIPLNEPAGSSCVRLASTRRWRSSTKFSYLPLT